MLVKERVNSCFRMEKLSMAIVDPVVQKERKELPPREEKVRAT